MGQRSSNRVVIGRRDFLRAGGVITVGATMPGLLVSCSSSDTSRGGSELWVSQPQGVGTLDPQKQGSMTDMSVLSNVFDFLTRRSPDGELVGGLAESWEAVSDTRWRFKLRKGVTFHNGEAFNADVAKFSIDRLLDPATKSPIVELVDVTGTAVVDEHTFEMVTKAADPLIPAKVSLFGGVMVPPKYIQEQGDDNFAKNPVGTGPFQFEEWQRDRHVKLSANDDYWDGAPTVQTLAFQPVPNPSSALSTLQSGDLGIVTGLTMDAVRQVEGVDSIEVVTSPSIRTYSITLDTLHGGPLGDQRVRQALNYGVNVEELVNTVLGGAAQQVATLLPKQVFGYDPSIEPYPYDPDRARSLLAEAGYADGFSIQLTAQTEDAKIVQAIAGQLSEVGVEAEVRIVNPGAYEEGLAAKQYKPLGPMVFVGNTGWTMDASSYMQSEIKSDRWQSRWHNQRADELVVTQARSVDPEVRKKAFSQLQKLVKESAPWIFLYQVENIYPMRTDISWEPNPIGLLRMAKADIQS